MDVLVQFIWIGDARHVEGFRSADEGPQRGTIGLSNNVIRNAVSASVPACWNLPSDRSTKLECFRYEDTGALLQLGKPLPALASPNVTFIAVLKFELLSFGLCHFNRLQIVNKLNFLIENLLAWIITTEKLRF